MPVRARATTGEIEQMLEAMLQLLNWQEQLIRSTLNRLKGRSSGRGRRAKRGRKVPQAGTSTPRGKLK